MSFQWFLVPDVRKVGWLNRRVRRWLFSTDMKIGRPLCCEVHFQIKLYKTPHSRTTFWSSDVQKSYAAVARCSLKSKRTKHLSVGAKNSTPLWREENFQVKMLKKNPPVRATFEVPVSKIARPCGTKRILKSMCTKCLHFETLLEISMSQRCATEEIHRLMFS